MPTRIIDISSRREPFLVEGSTLTARYVALSYCWGSEQYQLPPKTTCRNLDLHKNRIVLSELPLLFREAIQVTKALEVQYIWIDSLCIIQDIGDHDCEKHRLDWNREGIRMAEYYGNALLTISPLSSSNCKESMLQLRTQKPCENIGTTGLMFTAPVESWQEIFKSSVLQSRAWVLQERLLSRRVIHYSKDELFWECFRLSRRESSNEPLEFDDLIDDREDVGLKQSIAPVRLLNPDLQNIIHPWQFVISNYTARCISNEADRLVGISGIAIYIKTWIERTTGRDPMYMAGLWKDHGTTFLWEELHSEQSNYLTSGNAYIAPSWSWASVNNPIDINWDDWFESPNRSSPFNAKIGEFIMPNEDLGWTSGFNVMGQIPPGSRLSLSAFALEVSYDQNGRGTFQRPGLVRRLDDSKLGEAYVSKHYYEKLGTIAGKNTCTAVWLTEIFANRKHTMSLKFVGFLLLVRMRDLQQTEIWKSSSNTTFLSRGNNTCVANSATSLGTYKEGPELWVRIGSGRTDYSDHKPTEENPLGSFYGSKRRDFILI